MKFKIDESGELTNSVICSDKLQIGGAGPGQGSVREMITSHRRNRLSDDPVLISSSREMTASCENRARLSSVPYSEFCDARPLSGTEFINSYDSTLISDRSRIPCIYSKRPGGCNKGDACGYKHYRSKEIRGSRYYRIN